VLFGTAHWLPFVGASVIGVALTLALPVLWRSVPGRAGGSGPALTADLGEGLTAGALPAVTPP
jgi:hypothetical protein